MEKTRTISERQDKRKQEEREERVIKANIAPKNISLKIFPIFPLKYRFLGSMKILRDQMSSHHSD